MEPVLQIEALSHSYGERRALSEVNLNLRRGEFMALIGPNGSGKTTLMRCLAGVLKPTAGRIAIDGIALAEDMLAAKQRLGYAVDPVLLPDALTGDQCLKLFAEVRGLGAVPKDMFELAEALAFELLVAIGAGMIHPALPLVLYPLMLARHFWRARSA